MQAYQESAFSEAYQDARYEAEAETGLSIATFPDSVPYTVENVLDASWLPDAA